MASRPIASPSAAPDAAHFPARWACPCCQGPLERLGEDQFRCPADGRTFAREDGIWRFLPAERAAYYARFIQEYETVRTAEGRGSADPAYYRALPFADLTGRFAADWRIRAASYRSLEQRVLAPLEARSGPLTVLDLGAGNGWLAYRLAQRGHRVAAVDLSDSPTDGLGAHVHYDAPITPVQAEFDRLPFAAAQVDLVIFNGSLHYAADLLTTLREALRVLTLDGTLVILDSPVYRDPASGEAMVREREADFTRRFGFPSNAVPMAQYLTVRRLDDLAAATGLRWRQYRPRYGLAWALRPWRARLRRRREPAAFLVIAGSRGQPPPEQPLIRRTYRRVLGLALPLKRRRLARPVLERIDEHAILVLPGVFNPKVLRSGEFLARTLDQDLIPPGSAVLDLGTGSGIGAVAAARWAGRVVAVDINPEAIRCARINALLNRVEDRVDVRLGDLFAPVAGERFDAVLFNPPYYRGTPRDLQDHAWRSPDVVVRFARGLRDHLAPGGTALVILSTDGEADAFLAAFRAERFTPEIVARRDLLNEVLTIYRLRSEA